MRQNTTQKGIYSVDMPLYINTSTHSLFNVVGMYYLYKSNQVDRGQ